MKISRSEFILVAVWSVFFSLQALALLDSVEGAFNIAAAYTIIHGIVSLGLFDDKARLAYVKTPAFRRRLGLVLVVVSGVVWLWFGHWILFCFAMLSAAIRVGCYEYAKDHGELDI